MGKLKSFAGIAALSLMTMTGLGNQARADFYINLTTSGSTGNMVGTVGGTALLSQGFTLSGTGRFPSFSQISPGGNNTTSSGFNSTAHNNDNGNSATFNHAVLGSELSIVNVGGTNYFRFLLDVNENNGGGNQYVSLDRVAIITSSTPNQGGPGFTGLPSGTTVFDSGAQGSGNANHVGLDFSLETGSGRADMVMLIPVWAGFDPNAYVYLYSEFGALGINPGNGLPDGNYGQSDGFEEWAILSALQPIPVPAPPAVVLLASGGLVSFGGWVVRRRKAKA